MGSGGVVSGGGGGGGAQNYVVNVMAGIVPLLFDL